jgi:hypothetical protein
MNTIDEVKSYLIRQIRDLRQQNGDDPDWEILFDADFKVAGKTALKLEDMEIRNLIDFYGEHQNAQGFNEGLCK